MLIEIYKRQVAAFSARQSALLIAVGDSFDAIVSRIPKIPELSNGAPPFVIYDGESALFYLAKDGAIAKLPCHFSLDEKVVRPDFDAIYTFPVLNFGPIRFVPVDEGFHAPTEELATDTSDEDAIIFFKPLDDLFETYTLGVMSTAKESIVRMAINLKQPLERVCAENSFSIEEVMREPRLAERFVSMFEQAITASAAKVAREQSDEDDGAKADA